MGNSASANLRVVGDDSELDAGFKEPSQVNNVTTKVEVKAKTTDLMSSRQKRLQEEAKAKQQILEEHPMLKDVLDHVSEIAGLMKQYEDGDILKKTMNLAVTKSLEQLYNYYFDCAERGHRELIGNELSQKSASSSFVLYMNILTEDGQAYPLEGYKFECYQLLRSVCWNYSDVSLQLCDEFGRTGLLPLLLQDLKKFQNSFKLSSAQSFIVLSAMSVLHNCARSSNNAKYYNEMKAIDTVAWYAKNTADLQQMDVLAPLSAMTLAYIVDEEHNDIISADDSLIRIILKLLSGSLASSDHICDGFSAVELTEGLGKLASNADNSDVIMNLGVAKHLTTLLKEGNTEEKASAAKTVWILSFSDQNKPKINSDRSLIEALDVVAQSENPKIKNVANGALWILNGTRAKPAVRTLEKNPRMPRAPAKKKKNILRSGKRATASMPVQNLSDLSEDSDVSDKDIYIENIPESEAAATDERTEELQQNHVMISYQWEKQELMIRLKLHLEHLGYKVWMDVDEMGGSTLQSMAEAVEKAAVVLICFSRKYKDSVSCRTEAEYSYKCKKTIVPLRVESQYEPDGWLGAILGAKFYYDFSNLIMFEKTVSSLEKELGEKGKAKNAVKVIRAIAQATTSLPKVHRISDWTQQEVSSWAKEKNLPSFQTQNVDGRVLLFLRKLKQEAPEFFYNRISEQHGLKSIRDLMLFSDALDNLG